MKSKRQGGWYTLAHIDYTAFDFCGMRWLKSSAKRVTLHYFFFSRITLTTVLRIICKESNCVIRKMLRFTR